MALMHNEAPPQRNAAQKHTLHLQAGSASCRLPVSWENTEAQALGMQETTHITPISYKVH